MAKFKGRLDNAPVVYVLCQIRFSPVEKMADYVPAIQEALRTQYPYFEREQIGGVALMPNAQPTYIPNETRWRFETRDSLTGFILNTNQLIAHTTSYVDSADFRARIVFGFRTIQEIASIGFIQRIGLRYIDLISTSEDEVPEDYIDKLLVGFRPRMLGLTPDVSQQFLRMRSNISGVPGILLAKISRARHRGALPADLLPISLNIKRTPPQDRDSIFMDWDHYIENVNLDPDPKVLETTLRSLKAPIATIFQEAITDYAVKRWQRQ